MIPTKLYVCALDMQATVSQLGEGYLVVLKIFFLTLLISLPLGLLVSFGRMSKFAPLRWLVTLYISIMRGTPLILQLIAIYFLPSYLFEWNLSNFPFDYRFFSVIIGFGLNYAAYFAEIYRGGIESIPVGQYEAGAVLGFRRRTTFFRIILPQVVKTILPSMTNEIITLVKDTSLAYAISVAEMFFVAKALVSTQSTIVPLIVAGGFYYVTNIVIAFLLGRVEKKLNYYQ